MAAMLAKMRGGCFTACFSVESPDEAMTLRNGPSTKEMNMNIQKIGAALAIFMTAGMAGGAVAHADVPGSLFPPVQTAALPDTAAMPDVHGTMMDVMPRAHMPRSMQNENSYHATFPDNGFGRWWVGD
jgi:hypothetical protein